MATCQAVILEFQEAREPLHILQGVDRLSHLIFMVVPVKSVRAR